MDCGGGVETNNPPPATLPHCQILFCVFCFLVAVGGLLEMEKHMDLADNNVSV